MTNFITGLFEITLTTSLIIVLALIFSKLIGAKFSAKCRYIVWVLIILRLCVPINISLIPPIYTYELPVEDSRIEEETNIPTTPSIPDNTPTTSAPIVDAPVTAAPQTPSTPTVPDTTVPDTVIPDTTVTVPEPTTPSAPAMSVSDILYITGIVWSAIAVLVFVFRLTVHGIYAASLSKSKALPSPELSALYLDICEKNNIKKAPALYVSESVTSPMLCGFFRPCVILPDVCFSDAELEGIISHELTHFRRGDLWIKLLSLIAISLHWFNPFVYMAQSRLDQEMELSCDEKVLSGCDDEVRRIYGEAVLSVIRRNCHKSIALTTHFNPKKSAVKERFAAILDGSKKYRGRIIIAAALVLCALAGTVIGCSIEKEAPPDDENTDENMPNIEQIFAEANNVYCLFTGYGQDELKINYTGERIEFNERDYDAVEIDGITTLDGLKELGAKYFSSDLTQKLVSKEVTADCPLYIEQGGKLYRFGGYAAQYGENTEKNITVEENGDGTYTVRVESEYFGTPAVAYCKCEKDEEGNIRFTSFELTAEAYSNERYEKETLARATEHALELAKYFTEPISSADDLKAHDLLWKYLAGEVYELHTKSTLTLQKPDDGHYYIPYAYMHKAIELYLGIEDELPERLLRPEYNWYSDVDSFVYGPYSPTAHTTECVEAKAENGLYFVTVKISDSPYKNDIQETITNTYTFETVYDPEFEQVFKLVGITRVSDVMQEAPPSYEIVKRSYRVSVDAVASLNVPSSWQRDETFYPDVDLDEDDPGNASPYTGKISRLHLSAGSGNYGVTDDTDFTITGNCDAGYRYEGIKVEDYNDTNRYIFRISAKGDLYILIVREWTVYDSESFLEDTVLPIVRSFDVTLNESVVITDIADWDKLPYFAGPESSMKYGPNAYQFIYDLVSGKSNIPEYNELGIKDYSITLTEDDNIGLREFKFTFTVTGNSLPETLPPGTYTKILSDGYGFGVFDEDKSKNSYEVVRGLDRFGNISEAMAVHTYLTSRHKMEPSPFGEWDEEVSYPYAYICKCYGDEYGVIAFDELQRLMLEKFGIEVERPEEDLSLLGCKYEKERDIVYYNDTLGYVWAHRITNVRTESGFTYVSVQFYADLYYLLPSHEITYKMGEGDVFLSCEITKTGKYEPNSIG